MKRPFVIVMGLLVAGAAVLAKGLENWNRIGDANWRAEDGAIVADRGKGGFLVSKNAYRDFQIRAEFWADHTTNSGVFIRCSDPIRTTPTTPNRGNTKNHPPTP